MDLNEFNVVSSDDEVQFVEQSAEPPEENATAHDQMARLFYHEGRPARFFFHQTMKQGEKVKAKKTILSYGGAVTTTIESANILLVVQRRLTEKLATLRKRYDCAQNPALRDIWVQPITYLGECIDRKYFELELPRPTKRMPGRKPGRP